MLQNAARLWLVVVVVVVVVVSGSLCWFEGRKEILDWLNSYLDLNLSKVTNVLQQLPLYFL